jgi:putative endonuclease
VNRQQTGKLGEDIAVKYLKRKGYKILGRNFERKISRFLKSEIDIVARSRRSFFGRLRGKKNDIIHFIEVKTLINGQGFLPEQKVNFGKRKKLAKTAEHWLVKRKIPLESKWQIDVVSVRIESGTRKPQVSHFENVVSFAD